VGTDTAVCENLLVLIDDLFADQPDEGIIFYLVPQKFGAGHWRLSALLLESCDSSNPHGRIDCASRPFFSGVGQ
jgi:hypothetical protein